MTQRKAFTLVELMVAIGIIVVLIGLATVGLRYATAQSEANATKIAMENLKSMLAELELATKLRTPPAVWYRYTATWPNYDAGTWHTCQQTTFADVVDFYRIIDRQVPAVVGSPAKLTYAPARVTEDALPNLSEMEATPVLNTAILMVQLRTLPVNRDALDRMPPETFVKLQATPANAFPPAKGTEPAPPAVPAVQLVADGWRNPIIFVPGTTGLVLGHVYKSTVQYRAGQFVIWNDVSYRCTLDAINVTPGTSAAAAFWQPVPAIVAPNNRPFFASAGPDGDFSRGDDNIYSFEQ